MKAKRSFEPTKGTNTTHGPRMAGSGCGCGCKSSVPEYEEDDNTYKFYQTIRPYTKLNFPMNWLVDLTKAIDIIYRIYSMYVSVI